MKNILSKKKKQNKMIEKKNKTKMEKQNNRDVKKSVVQKDFSSNEEEFVNKSVKKIVTEDLDSSSSEEDVVKKTVAEEQDLFNKGKSVKTIEESKKAITEDSSSSEEEVVKKPVNKDAILKEDSDSDSYSSEKNIKKPIKKGGISKEVKDDSDSNSSSKEVVKKTMKKTKNDSDSSNTVNDDSSSIEEVSSSVEDADEETKDKRLVFIKGIPFNLDDIAVKKELKKIGRIIRVSVPITGDANRNKGFCFVEFLKEIDAKKCLKLDDKELFGRKISVSYANSPDKKTKFTIKVNNLPFVIDKDEFTEFITQYGECSRVAVPLDNETGRCLGFAFITYEDEKTFNKVLKTIIKYKDRTLYFRDGSAIRQESKDKFDIRKKRDLTRNGDGHRVKRKDEDRNEGFKKTKKDEFKKNDYKKKGEEAKSKETGNRIVFDSDSD